MVPIPGPGTPPPLLCWATAWQDASYSGSSMASFAAGEYWRGQTPGCGAKLRAAFVRKPRATSLPRPGAFPPWPPGPRPPGVACSRLFPRRPEAVLRNCHVWAPAPPPLPGLRLVALKTQRRAVRQQTQMHWQRARPLAAQRTLLRAVQQPQAQVLWQRQPHHPTITPGWAPGRRAEAPVDLAPHLPRLLIASRRRTTPTLTTSSIALTMTSSTPAALSTRHSSRSTAPKQLTAPLHLTIRPRPLYLSSQRGSPVLARTWQLRRGPLVHASSPGGVWGGCTGSALAKGALNPSWGKTPPPLGQATAAKAKTLHPTPAATTSSSPRAPAAGPSLTLAHHHLVPGPLAARRPTLFQEATGRAGPGKQRPSAGTALRRNDVPPAAPQLPAAALLAPRRPNSFPTPIASRPRSPQPGRSSGSFCIGLGPLGSSSPCRSSSSLRSGGGRRRPPL